MNATGPDDDLPDDNSPEACADDEMDFDDLYGTSNGEPSPEKPKGEASKVGANVDDSNSEKKEVASDGAPVAASEKTNAEKTKGKPRGRGKLRLADDISPEDARRRRVEIRIDPDELDTNVRDILTALGSTGKVFKRGRFIVEVVGFTPKNPEKHKGPILPGSPIIVSIESPAMQYTIAENCVLRTIRRVKDGFKECSMSPPPKLAAIVCKQGPRGDELQMILGVLECPSMRPDGTLITEPGIDEKTGYFLASNMVLPPIPDRPTIEDLNQSIEKLHRLFSGARDGKYGFFWANPEKDWVVPVAAFLALLARPAIDPPNGNVPAFAFHGTTPGSQKGKIINMICNLVTGRSAPISSWPMQKEEQEKEIGAIAMAGAPIAFWDEVHEAPGRILGNGRLHAALTADQTSFRVLGVSSMPVLPWRSVAFFAGNNYTLDPNFARRCLLAHLEAPIEKPAELSPDQFIWPDPEKEALDNRAEYVAAGLTILRYFHVMGRPKQGVTIGSFQKFADLVGGALKLAGAPNIADYVDKDPATETTEDGALRVVVREWARLPGVTEKTGLSIAAAIAHMYPDERALKIKRGEPMAPDGFEELRDALESMAPPRAGILKPDTDKLGKVFRGAASRWFGNHCLLSATNEKGNPYNPARWKVRTQATATQATGPNGCPLDVGCTCTPCVTCALCNWTPRERGGCTCCVDEAPKW